MTNYQDHIDSLKQRCLYLLVGIELDQLVAFLRGDETNYPPLPYSTNYDLAMTLVPAQQVGLRLIASLANGGGWVVYWLPQDSGLPIGEMDGAIFGHTLPHVICRAYCAWKLGHLRTDAEIREAKAAR